MTDTAHTAIPGRIAPTGAPAAPPPPPDRPYGAPVARLVTRGILAVIGNVLVALAAGAVLAAVVFTVFGGDTARSWNDVVDAFADVDFFAIVVLMAGLVFGGELSVDFLGHDPTMMGSLGGSLHVFPLLLTLAAAAAACAFGFRTANRIRIGSWRRRIVYSAAVGVATSIALAIAVGVGSPSVEIGTGDRVTVTSGGVRLAVFAAVVFAVATWIGTAIGARSTARTPFGQAIRTAWRRMPGLARDSAGYALTFAAVFAPLAFIAVAAAAWDELGAGPALAAALVAVPNVTAWLAVLAQLGGIDLAAELGMLDPWSDTATMFDAHWWMWFAVALAVAATFVVAVRIGIRRPRRASIDWTTAWRMPLVIAGAWILFGVTVFGLSGSGRASAYGVSLSYEIAAGMSWWTPLVLLAWAAAAELAAQTLPVRIHRRAPRLLSFVGGRTAVEEWIAAAADAGTNESDAAPDAGADAPGATPDAVGAPAIDGAAPEHAAAPASLTPAAPASLTPAQRRLALWLGIGIVAVGSAAVVSAVSIAVVNAQTRSPEAVVGAYMDHLEHGRASAANAMADPNVPTEARAFLSDAVLGSAVETITNVEVRAGEPSLTGRDRQVEVRYELDGVDRYATFTLERLDNEWLVLERWRITDPLVEAATVLPGATPAASIGGKPVLFDAEDADWGTEVVLYPGVYEVAPDASEFYDTKAARLTVAPGDPTVNYAELFPVPTEALRETVQAQLDASLDACAESTDAFPDGCPFRAALAPAGGAVSWSIATYPEVELNAAGTHFQARAGTARADFTDTWLGKPRKQQHDAPLNLVADISVVDGQVGIVYGSGGFVSY